MPTDIGAVDINAAIARTAREKAQASIDALDIRLIAVASVWFAFYIMMLIGAIVGQTFASVIELSARY